jgi:Bacterial conjugation TrbI-like protein
MSQQLSDEELWGVLNTNATTATLIQPEASERTEVKPEVSPIASAADFDDDFDDDDDDFDDDAQSHRTLPNFAGSPLARMGLIGTIGLAVIIAVGGLIGGFQGQVKDASKKDQQQSPDPAQFATPTVAAQSPGDGNLKAQMAFQTQKNPAANPDIKTTPPPAPAITATPTPATNTTSLPAPPPPPVPIAVSPTPIAEPAPPPVFTSSPIPVSPIPLGNLPPADPNKAWNDLAQSATYGSLPVMITPSAPPPVTVVMSAPKSQSPQSDMGGLPSLSSYQLQSSNPRRKLRIGTQVKATLLNPIAWSGDGKDIAFSGNGAPTPKFIARLEQPLKDMDGNEVIPQGAEIVIAVRSLEPRSGMAELTALQMIIDNQEYAPPIGAITLRGAKGNPLIADKFQDKGKDIAAADRSMFFFGALSKVGELLNRTDSNVVITAGGSSSSSSSGKPNVLGGVLQGGFGALAQQQQQRNQQWLQEIIQRPDIRYIPAGKELSLYINQTVTL